MPELVAAGITLREQVNRRFPKRDKASDGTIASPEHRRRSPRSDHNPDAFGWIHALDIDEDFGRPGAAREFADQLIELARAGRDAGRLKYVIYEGRIASGTHASARWRWREHTGDPHRKHIHISFTAKAQRNGSPFDLPILEVPSKDEPAKPAKKASKRPAKKAVP